MCKKKKKKRLGFDWVCCELLRRNSAETFRHTSALRSREASGRNHLKRTEEGALFHRTTLFNCSHVDKFAFALCYKQPFYLYGFVYVILKRDLSLKWL